MGPLLQLDEFGGKDVTVSHVLLLSTPAVVGMMEYVQQYTDQPLFWLSDWREIHRATIKKLTPQ